MSESQNLQSALDVLARIVDASAPRRLLCCGETACRIAQRWGRVTPEAEVVVFEPGNAQSKIEATAAADLALVSDTLEQLDHESGTRLLGLLRNYGTQRIAVLAPTHGAWQFNDFIALGFRRHAELADDLTLFSYKLESYNHKRDWNNPRNWANPDMWDKARW